MPTGAPTGGVLTSCVCGPNEQPIYDNLPHPGHNDSSFIVINFYNDGSLGPNTTVWITVTFAPDPRMVIENPLYKNGYQYAYLDAQPLAQGQFYQLVIDKSNTVNGRLPGGNIIIYYRDPAEFDTIRNGAPFNGSFTVQTPGQPPVPIETVNGGAIGPLKTYSQLLEVTFDVNRGDNPDTQAFVDYDISGVDSLAVPVYIYGGYDAPNRIIPGSLEDPNSICKKAYIGCETSQAVVEGCPTQVQDVTAAGGNCLASFPYCQLATDATLAASTAVFNKTRWSEYCHLFDLIYAQGFGINQSSLDLYNGCAANRSLAPPCPPYTPPVVSTPTNVIYGGVGQFLLENHCLGPDYAGTRSRLDGAQVTAINRGLCFTPDYFRIPLPDGLSCARFTCTGVECPIFCNDYATCFGFTCADYAPFFTGLQNQSCGTTACDITAANCINVTSAISKNPRVSTCNDSTSLPYQQNLTQNEYAAWARGKGERFYAFSLDEETGGGNLACLYSTQLDIVIFPRCNGTYPG